MSTALTSPAASPVALAGLAWQCLSAALQLDYLSNGAAHLNSKAVLKPGRRPPQRSAAPAGHAEGGETPADIAGHYLADLARHGRLTSSEEYRLARRARAGDTAAARELAEHNLGLVVMIARRYAHGPLALLDLIQEGNLGLMTACEKFDPERGFRLSTYAKWWIRQSIELALMTQSQAVHIPAHAARTARQRQRQAAAGEAPAAPEAWAGASPDEAAVADTDALLQALPAPPADEPEQRLLRAQQGRCLGGLLAGLGPAERQVLVQRFGLGDGEVRTLATIAAQLGLSCERVRQIEGEALARLRQLARRRGMAGDSLL